MKEIRIVLNNNQETFLDDAFYIYVDNRKLENITKFNLEVTKPIPDETGFINCDNIIKYTVEHFAPYFEEAESNDKFQTKITEQTEKLFSK